MKQKISKLDAYAERLTDWFTPQDRGGRGLTLAEAQAQLKLDGCMVSLSRLSAWWQEQQNQRQQEMLLTQIANGSRQCRDVEKVFASNPAPEIETIIKLHRVLIMKLSTQANAEPEMLELVGRLMKPTMEFAKLQEKRRELELQETKYRDQVAERKRAIEAELNRANTSGGITPETREKIERELKLL